jgi:hypothetical protein
VESLPMKCIPVAASRETGCQDEHQGSLRTFTPLKGEEMFLGENPLSLCRQCAIFLSSVKNILESGSP